MENELNLTEERMGALREEMEALEAEDKKKVSPVTEEKNPLEDLEKTLQELKETHLACQGRNLELAKMIAIQDKRIVNFTGQLVVGLKEKGQSKPPSALSSTMHKNAHPFTKELSKVNKRVKAKDTDVLEEKEFSRVLTLAKKST